MLKFYTFVRPFSTKIDLYKIFTNTFLNFQNLNNLGVQMTRHFSIDIFQVRIQDITFK